MKSIWKGSITFGLVNIPVEMYSASTTREIKFSLLHKKDLSPIRYARFCKEEDKEVPWNEIVKGYENEQGKIVVMSEEEIKKAASENTRTIDIIQFVEDDEIDSVYFDKPYILEPSKTSDKAYSLLMDALKKSKKVGVARYVLHGREHIGIVKSFEDFLILNQLRFQSELLNFEDLKVPKKTKLNPKEIQIAVQLIDQMTSPFKPDSFKDTYTKALKKTLKTKKPHAKKDEAKAKSPKVHDIMSLLKASISKTG